MNKTKNEHFIPQFFIKQFYSTKNDMAVNSVKGRVCCVRFNEDKIFNCFSDKICFEKDLYETAAINNNVKNALIANNKELETITNYFENKFCKAEGYAKTQFRKMLLLLDRSKNKQKVLSNKKIEFLTQYMLLQFFRLPSLLSTQIISLYNVFCEINNKCCKIDVDGATVMLHTVLEVITKDKSPIIKEFSKDILTTHDVCVVKATRNFSFFTGDMPIFFFGDLKEGENIFQQCDISFPISPKYCLTFIKKNNKKHFVYHKTLLYSTNFLEELYINNFIKFVLPNTTFIFSDKIPNKVVEKLKKYKKQIIY